MKPFPAALLSILLAAATADARIEAEEGSFDEGLELVRETMRDADWKDARSTLLELLQQHRDRAEVMARRFEVEELLRQCAFRIAHPAPDPATEISGELVSRDLRTGRLELHYTPNNLGDFEKSPALIGGGVVYVHPAVFDGSYSITIEGPSYPSSLMPALLPAIVADVDISEVYVVNFGQRSDPDSSFLEITSNAVLQRRIGSTGESKTLSEKKEPPTTPGEPFELEVRVSGRSIQARYNGRTLLRGNRQDAGAGRVGFACDASEFTRVVIKGKSNRSWLESLSKAKVHEHYDDFMRGYDVNQDLPEWLRFPAPDPAAANDELIQIELRLTEDEQRHVEQISLLTGETDIPKALRYLQTIPPDEMSHFVRDAYRALLLQGAGEIDDALLCITRASEFRPDNVDVQRFRARLLTEAGHHEEAIDELDDLLESNQDDAQLLHLKARSYFWLGRRAEAEAVIDDAMARSVRSAELDLLKRLLFKSARGPDWNRAFRHQTKHFEIHSDISPATCKEVGRLLERVYKTYQHHLHPVDDADGRRSSVYVFSTETGYLSHIRDIMEVEPRHTAGLYSHELKQLFLWQVPDHEMFRRTVAHEALHLYLDLIADDAPIWLHEGLAEYCEVAQFEFGDWTEGQIHETDGAIVKHARDQLIPIQELLSLSREQFYRKALLHYAESWAFVHFLRNGRSDPDFFDRWFAAVAGGAGSRAAIEELLGDLDAVQVEFDRYLDGLVAK